MESTFLILNEKCCILVIVKRGFLHGEFRFVFTQKAGIPFEGIPAFVVTIIEVL